MNKQAVSTRKMNGWNPTMDPWKMMFLFNWVILRFQLFIFRGCIPAPYFLLIYDWAITDVNRPKLGEQKMGKHMIFRGATAIFFTAQRTNISPTKGLLS